jgi:hypothetical protein
LLSGVNITGITHMTLKNHCIVTLAVFAFLFLFTSKVFSQPVDIDSLKIGMKYKVILFSDREIEGLLINTDSVYIRILDDKNIYKIRKTDVLRIETFTNDVVGAYLFSFYGGYGVAPVNHMNSNKIPIKGFNVGADVIFPIFKKSSRSSYMRLSLCYSGLNKPSYTDDMYLAIYPPSYNMEDESNISLTILRTDYILGNISPSNKFIYFFSAGVGFCLFHESAYTTYFVQNDTIRSTDINGPENTASLVLGLGISGGYKINKNFGIQAQIEYDLFTEEKLTDRFKKGYLLFKLGIFYFF